MQKNSRNTYGPVVNLSEAQEKHITKRIVILKKHNALVSVNLSKHTRFIKMISTISLAVHNDHSNNISVYFLKL